MKHLAFALLLLSATAEILAKMEELAAKRGSEKMVKTFDSRYVDALKANSAALE